MILVDSDVVIAHLRGVRAAEDWMARARREAGRLGTSVVTIAEVAGGMRGAERREVARLLSSFRPFPVTERIAWRAAENMRKYRPSHSGIGLGDYLVAATAQIHGLELATLDIKHFPMFSGLRPPFNLT